MKKVLITIRGINGIDSEKDSVEFMTKGIMRKTAEDDYILSYDDNQILKDSGGKPVKTRLKFEKNNRVTIERGGDLSSKIVIEKGVRNSCFYNVSSVDLTLGIYGKTIRNELGENGGRINLSYLVDSNLTPIGENKIEITVKEV
ncbi:MAG: DUF1934 domain-containing protein [Clostridia bacterium]|nr:DUF1934 domain-containing protein [Clostridia bacterium]